MTYEGKRKIYHGDQQSECSDRDRVESVGMTHAVAFLVGEPGLRDCIPDDRVLTETDGPFLVLLQGHC